MTIICYKCHRHYSLPKSVEWIPLPQVGVYAALCRDCYRTLTHEEI